MEYFPHKDKVRRPLMRDHDDLITSPEGGHGQFPRSGDGFQIRPLISGAIFASIDEFCGLKPVAYPGAICRSGLESAGRRTPEEAVEPG